MNFKQDADALLRTTLLNIHMLLVKIIIVAITTERGSKDIHMKESQFMNS